jgi:hypothetical protein
MAFKAKHAALIDQFQLPADEYLLLQFLKLLLNEGLDTHSPDYWMISMKD